MAYKRAGAKQQQLAYELVYEYHIAKGREEKEAKQLALTMRGDVARMPSIQANRCIRMLIQRNRGQGYIGAWPTRTPRA